MEKKENNHEKKKIVAPVYWRRLYKQFKIFYASKYGRTGFYILLAFAVITLLTPFVVSNMSYSAIAPEIDTHVASELIQTDISNASKGGTKLYEPMASMVDSTGTDALYFGTNNGMLYYYSLGGTKALPESSYGNLHNFHLKSGVTMAPPIMISLINCQLIQVGNVPGLFERIVISQFSNKSISIGSVTFEDSSQTIPNYKALGTITYNGTLISNIDTNSIAFTTSPENDIPVTNTLGIGYAVDGMLYFVTNTTSGNYLHVYQIYPTLLESKIKLNMSDPKAISFYGYHFTGSDYTNSAKLLISNNTTISAFSANNYTKLWTTQINGTLNSKVGLTIPTGYQISPKAYDSAYFIINGNQIQIINLNKGVIYPFANATNNITELSVTPGLSGPPSYVIASTATNQQVFSYNSTGKLKVTVEGNPVNSGLFITPSTYDPTSGSLILVSQRGAILSFALGASTGGYPLDWSAVLSPTPTFTSKVLYFKDINTGGGEIATITNSNYLYIYNATAKQCTPIPPMANTPSGNSFPLGTTQYGHNVWSRFMDSFSNDWIFGISIGFFTLIISLLVALYVGYKGGLGGTVLETVSLSLYLVPGLALLIALASVLPGNSNYIDIILIVSLIGWPFSAFTLIGLVKSIRSRAFVEASRLFGSRSSSIMRRHILPNIGPLLVYLLALSIGAGIGSVSGLQFLGLVPVNTATWGGMLNAAFTDYFQVIQSPQWIFPPAIALSMFIFSLIFISRGMDEVTNPRLRRR